MKPKQDLYDLVNSLSSLEVSGFRNEITKRKGKHTYLKLFDALLEMEEYDEYALKKRFKGEKTLNNFSVAKANLYEKILEVIVQLPQNQNMEVEFDHVRQQVSILVKKGLFEQALQRVEKSIRMAEKLEAFRKLAELYEVNREIIRSYYSPTEFLDKSKEMKERDKMLTEVEANLKSYKDLFDQASIAQRAAPNISRMLTGPILIHRLMQDESEALSVTGRILFNRTWKLIYEIQRREGGWKFFSLRIIGLLEGNPHLLNAPANFIVYVDTVTDFGIRCIANKEYDDAETALRRLKKLRKSLNAGENEAMIYLRFWKVRLHHGLKTLLWEQTQLSLKRLENGLRKYRNKISKKDEMELTYLIAQAYLTFGMEKKAIPWIISLRDEKISPNRPDLHLFSWFLFLLAHFSQKNFDILEQQLPRTKQYLKDNQAYGPFEQGLVEFFERSVEALDPIHIRRALEALQKSVEEYHEENPKFRIEDYFELRVWIHAQLEKIPLKDALLREG